MDYDLNELPRLDSLPRCEEDPRYTKSFRMQTSFPEDILEFFHTYGFVVFRDVFSVADCEASREAIWDVLEAQNEGLDRHVESTWSKLKTKGNYGLSIRGPSFHPQLVRNRQHPELAAALSLLCETPAQRLLVSQDRFALYRATHSPASAGATAVAGEAPAHSDNLHWDMNPTWYLQDSEDVKVGLDKLSYADPQDFIRENNLYVRSMGVYVQCVLNFLDNRAEDGGTLLVPMAHRHLQAFATQHAALFRPLPWLSLPADLQKAFQQAAHRACLREGSVLVWDQRVLHGTQPNNSSRCRFAQYLRAGERYAGRGERLQRRAQAVLRGLREAGAEQEVSELGTCLFGLDVL
eukprot:gene28171-34019_t